MGPLMLLAQARSSQTGRGASLRGGQVQANRRGANGSGGRYKGRGIVRSGGQRAIFFEGNQSDLRGLRGLRSLPSPPHTLFLNTLLQFAPRLRFGFGPRCRVRVYLRHWNMSHNCLTNRSHMVIAIVINRRKLRSQIIILKREAMKNVGGEVRFKPLRTGPPPRGGGSGRTHPPRGRHQASF